MRLRRYTQHHNLHHTMVSAAEGGVQARLFLDNHWHPSTAGTRGICTAACAQIPGTIVHSATRPPQEGGAFVIHHPSGQLPKYVETLKRDDTNVSFFDKLSSNRTASHIVRGELMVPKDVVDYCAFRVRCAGDGNVN